MRSLASILLSTLVLVATSTAHAEDASSRAADDRDAMLALGTGAVAAAVPMAIGGAHAGRDELPFGQRDQGWIVAAAGLALAPVASHLVTREYGRAAAFGALPTASAVGIGALLAAKPDSIYTGNRASRVSFTVLFATCSVTSAVGVIDAAFAPERRRAREKKERRARVDVDLGPGRVGLRGAF